MVMPREKGIDYHLFVSHAWQSAQDQARVIKERLVHMLPELRVFLDVDDMEEGRGMEYVDRSAHVLAFCRAVARVACC